KHLEDRYRSIKDLRIELKELARELTTKLATSAPPVTSASRGAQDPHPTADRQAISGVVSAGQSPVSSAEYIVSAIKLHKRDATVFSVVVLAIAALLVWFFAFYSPTVAQINSIAVMPFANASGNADI